MDNFFMHFWSYKGVVNIPYVFVPFFLQFGAIFESKILYKFKRRANITEAMTSRQLIFLSVQRPQNIDSVSTSSFNYKKICSENSKIQTYEKDTLDVNWLREFNLFVFPEGQSILMDVYWILF